jgi:stalled ribosome rescue protein Dom34
MTSTKMKDLGIWMDHAEAHLISFNTKPSPVKVINTAFDHEDMESALNKSEHLMNNKRQQFRGAYFKEIADEILKYDQVLLFGPTNAKTELFNYIHKDLHFRAIKIDLEPADKMTKNEKNAFVKNHFEKQSH